MKKTLTATLAALAASTLAEATPPIRQEFMNRDEPVRAENAPPKPKADPKLKALLPKAPKGYLGPKNVAVRTPSDIFEQINGGSVSFLDHGMTDAVFARYPKKGGAEGTELQVEVYRFKDADGAGKQFNQLLGEPGKPWQAGRAVQHDFGIEAVVGRYLLRATFADGPAENRVAANAIADELAAKVAP